MYRSEWEGAKTPIMLAKNVDFSCREQPESSEGIQLSTQVHRHFAERKDGKSSNCCHYKTEDAVN